MTMSIGSFPGFRELNRRTIRGPVNPLDKSTVVSIYPKKLPIRKLTLIPGYWEIESGSPESPSLLIVGPSSWFKETDPNEPLLEIPTSSIQIADSIVRDFCNGVFGSDQTDSQPGLFFVPGAHKHIDSVEAEYPGALENAIRQQKNYYNILIRTADSLWAETSGNPIAITEEMKLAARSMGVQDRDWMKDYQRQDQVRCIACGAFKNPQYPVCPSCRAVDSHHQLAKTLRFAEP